VVESWFGKGFVALTGIGIAFLLLSPAKVGVSPGEATANEIITHNWLKWGIRGPNMHIFNRSSMLAEAVLIL
jgi:hypothetical protein